MAKRDRYGQNPYGGVHQKLRKRWAARVRAGGVDCWRCGKPIPAGARWDLGHVDEEHQAQFGTRHAEHVRCNRATLPRMLAAARGEASANADPLPQEPSANAEPHDCREDFDPQRCPECRRRDPTPESSNLRWGRHWWGGFNPRCRDCRRLGEACEEAEKAA
jgi:hypothetical protein